RQVLRIEGLNRGDPRFGVDQAAPDMLDANAQGTGNAHARHHHTPHRSRPFHGCRAQPYLPCFSMYSMASFTVAIFSAASSGISTLNASSKAITSSTVSRLSAPRSSIKDASGVTLLSSTPRCSTTICLILSAISLIGSATPDLWSAYRFVRSCLQVGRIPTNEAAPVPDKLRAA